MLKAGIIGLPNVGKSSLFNALTKANALAANYPFATIEPNVGVVILQDQRLDFLEKLYQPKRLVPTSFEFIDIAGLVKGASKGEGLGNKFLSQIREVDAICEVVRFFNDENITHVAGKVDPMLDADVIKLELYLADLEIIQKRLPKMEKKIKAKEKDAELEYSVLKKIEAKLLEEKDPKTIPFSKEEEKLIKSFNFLSLKPIIYLLNISETDIEALSQNPTYLKFLDKAKAENAEVIPVSVKLELDLLALDDADKEMFLQEYKLEKSALDNLVEKTYQLLGLKTFFTVGKDEVRAWTFKDGSTAYDCAGIIHTDFQKGFIAAEVLSYDDLLKYKNYETAKANGKVRSEGRKYLFKDGDIVVFRFNL